MDFMLLRNLSYESGPKMEKVWRRLPSDLVERIVGFLPVDAVCRFRCLGKRWNTLALQQVRPAEAGLLVLGTSLDVVPDTSRFCNSLPEPIVVSTLHIPLPEGVLGELHLCSASRGLVCFGDRKSKRIFVCNPLLRRWKKLPEPDSQRRFRAETATILAGESNDSYIVFCTSSDEEFIYDSREGRWKAVGEIPDSLREAQRSKVFYEEQMHFTGDGGELPVALNLETGTYRDCDFFHVLPPAFGCYDIVEHRGSLFFVGLDEDAKTCSIYKLSKEIILRRREWQHLARGSLKWLLEKSCEDFDVQVIGFGKYLCVNVSFKFGQTTMVPSSAILAYDIANNSWSRWSWDYHQVNRSVPRLISMGLSLSRLP